MKTTRTIKWKGILASLLATVQAGMLFPSAGASAQTSPGGDYGQATIDGVISPDEYPESAKISLQASDFLGLKLDYSGAAEVPADLKIDLYVMWSEAGLSIGYTVEDSTPYHGAPNTFTADQLALMIDLGSSAQGGTSLKGKTLTDASSPQLGGNRAPRFNSFLDSEGTFMWLHQWVPSEGILNQVEGLSQYCAGQTIIKEEQIVGFSGEYLIPWWLLAQDMNQKTGEELFDIEEVAKGTVIGEGFEVAIMPVYYNYAVDGTGLGQYAAVTSDWFALEPDYAGVSLRLKAKATDADPTPDPDTDTDTDYDRPVIRPANGNYGAAKIDGVIEANEYPEKSTYILTAKGMKGLKMDFSGVVEIPENFRMELHLMWSEEGLFVGYTVKDGSTYFGAPGSYSSDQLALLIDLGHSSEGGTSLKGKTLADASTPQLNGNRAPRFNSLLDSQGTFLWLHQWVPNESNLHLVEGLSELCAGRPLVEDGRTVGFSGEYLIPWWLLAEDMNQKTGETLFNIEEVAKGTVIGEGFEIAITPVYYDFAADGTAIGQYAAVNSDWFALEPDYAGLSFRLDKGTLLNTGKKAPNIQIAVIALSAMLVVIVSVIPLRRRKEQTK